MFKKKKQIKKFILSYILFLFSGICTAFFLSETNEKNYQLANSYLNSEDYNEAYELYSELGEYKDSDKYTEALSYFINEDYQLALKTFEEIKNYKDSYDYIKEAKYKLAIQYYNNKDYDNSKQFFLALDNYKDCEYYLGEIEKKTVVQLTSSIYEKACKYFENEDYEKALDYFNSIIDYKKSKKYAKLCEEYIQNEDKLRTELSHTIAAGSNYFLGISESEQVKFSGKNDYRQGDVNSWENMVSVDGYSECTIGLKNDGTVETTGTLNKNQTNNMLKLKHVIDIAAGENYVVALKINGNVVAEGHNGNGQCNVKDWKDIIDIDCAWGFTVGLDKQGNLHFAGNYNKKEKNHSPKKDEWEDVIKISASGGDPLKHRGGGHVVGLKANGRVIAIGDNDFGQCDVGDWENIVAIAAGDWYTVGLTNKGKIKITGENNPNGIEHTVYKNNEIMNEWKKMNIKDIAAGYGITLVLNEKSQLDAMGFVEEEERKDIKDWKIKSKSN